MASDHGDARLGELASATADDLLQQPGAELVARESGDAEREERFGANRVDVAQRVGRGDGAEVGGTVDDGREEVDRRDQRAVRRDAIDGRVIAGGRTMQHVGVDDRGQRPEYLPYLHPPELPASTAPVPVLRQTHR